MIYLNDDYSINADTYNFILVKHGINSKTGEPTTTNIAYSPKIKYLLETMYERETREWVLANNATLEQAIRAFKYIEDKIITIGEQLEFDVDKLVERAGDKAAYQVDQVVDDSDNEDKPKKTRKPRTTTKTTKKTTKKTKAK